MMPEAKDVDLKEQLKSWTIVPPANPAACFECATMHAPEAPHNRDSLNYQYNFAQKNGRWPTWKDASDHCSDAVISMLKEVLTKKNVSFED